MKMKYLTLYTLYYSPHIHDQGGSSDTHKFNTHNEG